MSSTTVLGAAAGVVVRSAAAADARAIKRMVERCSTSTRQRRFHGGTAAIPAAYLARIGSPPPGDLHVVALAGRRVVALASFADGELGLLVEDEWQGGGLGRTLLRHVLERVDGPVMAEVGEGNELMRSWLRRLAPTRIVPQRYGWRFVLDPDASLVALGAQRRAAA